MRMKTILKKIAFGVLGSEVMVSRRLKKVAQSEKVIILNLHRVAPADGSSYKPLSPDLFRQTLEFLTTHCHITDLDNLTAVGHEKPAVVLSFDDGYWDFIEYAVPIMEDFGVRANMNVIPTSIETGEPPLNVMAQDFLGKVSREAFAAVFADIQGVNPLDTSTKISAQLKFRPMDEQIEIRDKVRDRMLGTKGFAPTRMMSRSDVIEIARYHDVGAHSMQHASMTSESDAFLRDDAQSCIAYFEENLGFKPQIYAFPNGAARESQLDILRSLGFRTTLLVGNDFATARSTELPRFTFSASTAAEGRFRCAGERAVI